MACPSCVIGLMGTEQKADSTEQTVKVAMFAGLAAAVALLAYGILKGKKAS